MKIYFDNLEATESNLTNLQSFDGNNYWVVSNGTVLKTKLKKIGYQIDLLENLNDPGCYFIDLNGDPLWWGGEANGTIVPNNIISYLSEDLCKLVREKKLRLILAADKEGGPMVTRQIDVFRSTTNAMTKRQLPIGSVLILHGNINVAESYKKWIMKTGSKKMFEVQYSSHFTQMFYDKELFIDPLFQSAITSAEFDFNSLNRVYRPHRGAHCVFLHSNDLLSKGLVSCNQIVEDDTVGPKFLGVSQKEFIKKLTEAYPIYVDGNWADINAAEKFNYNLYENSLMTFVTETKFDEDVIFPTEKIYKPIAFGHPFILLSSPGTLKAIQDLGFSINFCGIDPSYNDIQDDKERFIQTNNILKWWINLSRDEKIKRILDSRENILHNFNLIRQNDFYAESLHQAIRNTRRYFNG